MASAEAELRRVWQRVVGSTQAAAVPLDGVVALYSHPDRHYHSLRHVVAVCRSVDELAVHEAHTDLPAILAAALFHDVIYDASAADSEARSAALAGQYLSDVGWPAPRVQHVADMILATSHHLGADDSSADASFGDDTKILLDADLSILGAEPAVYQHYALGVRREYHHIDDVAWRRGRLRVLSNLATRPRLFVTATQHARLDQRARANLAAEIAALSPPTTRGSDSSISTSATSAPEPAATPAAFAQGRGGRVTRPLPQQSVAQQEPTVDGD